MINPSYEILWTSQTEILRQAGLMLLAQDGHHLGAQAESGLGEAGKGIFKADQIGAREVAQKAGRTGDAKAEDMGNLAPPFFIHDLESGVAMPPGEGDGGML